MCEAASMSVNWDGFVVLLEICQRTEFGDQDKCLILSSRSGQKGQAGDVLYAIHLHIRRRFLQQRLPCSFCRAVSDWVVLERDLFAHQGLVSLSLRRRVCAKETEPTPAKVAQVSNRFVKS